jgi:outer membrane protein assembly factor BamB
MNCAEVNQKIELFVLDELPKTEQLAIKAHLITCPVCKVTEDRYRLLITNIKATAQPELPSFDFAHAVRSAVRAEIRSIALGLLARRIIAITASVAACLLFALLIWHVWNPSGSKVGSVTTKKLFKDSLGDATSAPGAPSILQAWQHRGARSVPGSMADEVVVRGQNMYLLQEHGLGAYVAALDVKTGKQKWLSDIQSCGYLLADNSCVYCLAPSKAGPAKGGLDPLQSFSQVDLVALDASNGKTLWKYPQKSPYPLRSPCHPTLLPTGCICWTTNTTVHVLSCANGKPLWTHSISDGGLLSSAAVVNNNLYVANSIGLYCLNITTGNESYRLAWGESRPFAKGRGEVISGRDQPLLAATDGEIYAALSLGFGATRLLCMELTGQDSHGAGSHKILWSKVVAHVTHLYAISDMLYLRDQNIQALDGTTGRLLWSCPATGCNPVTYAEGLAYFVDTSHQGCLVALDMYTGSKVWELAGMRSCNAFIKVDSTGFLKTHDGVIHAIIFKG